MRAYIVFDDFPREAVAMLCEAGVEVTVHTYNRERPNGDQLKKILQDYHIIIIGTGQKISEDMCSEIDEARIIATASVGTDHISIPENKKTLIKIVNAPLANRISVAEHTFALALELCKRLEEGKAIAAKGRHKQDMESKPRDLYGKTIGVIGAGGTASAVLKMADGFGMQRMCWTKSPGAHEDLWKDGVRYVELTDIFTHADVISVNIPLTKDTEQLISSDRISLLKEDAIFISMSRAEVVDCGALLKRAAEMDSFSVGMDVDADSVYGMWEESMRNVIITPHIGGGTVEARKRLFVEISRNILAVIEELK